MSSGSDCGREHRDFAVFLFKIEHAKAAVTGTLVSETAPHRESVRTAEYP